MASTTKNPRGRRIAVERRIHSRTAENLSIRDGRRRSFLYVDFLRVIYVNAPRSSGRACLLSCPVLLGVSNGRPSGIDSRGLQVSRDTFVSDSLRTANRGRPLAGSLQAVPTLHQATVDVSACMCPHARTHARVFRCASTRWNTRVTDSEGSSIRPRWTLPHAGLHGTHLDSHNSFVYEPVVSLPPPPSCDVLHLITCWKMGNV